MRITLTMDTDIEQLLLRDIRRSRSGMKAVANDALRLGLEAAGRPAQSGKLEVKPHAFGFRTGVDVDRLNQLIDALEVEEFTRRRGD